jgi:hypothetical protein
MTNADHGGIVAVNLIPMRPGVPVDDFAHFSATVDQPLCLQQPIVQSFEVYRVNQQVPGLPQIDIVELMRVRDWAEWEKVRDNLDALRPVMDGFDRLVDASSVRTLFATPIRRND